MTINDTDLKREFIANPDKFKRLIITGQQVGLVKYIRSGAKPMTAAQLAALRKISIHNASQQLETLWWRGYLIRTQEADETGEIYYTYAI